MSDFKVTLKYLLAAAAFWGLGAALAYSSAKLESPVILETPDNP